jgi:hypothetical protein
MAEDLAGMMIDQLAMLTTRTALDAWLTHPKTMRFRERLRHSPHLIDTWRRIESAITAATEFAIDDRGDTPCPTS